MSTVEGTELNTERLSHTGGDHSWDNSVNDDI